MATLDSLKWALRQKVAATSSPRQPLSDIEYKAGFDTIIRDSGWTTYQDFIIPQLAQLLDPLFNSRIHISVLEVGPGPRSVLGYLPGSLKRKIARYVAFEPNGLFARNLEEWLCSTSEIDSPLPCLKSPPQIHQTPFDLCNNNTRTDRSTSPSATGEKFDVILFCHSMYGMKPKRKFIERALGMLEQPEGRMVVVFHRDGTLHLDGLVCHRTASFPTGILLVENNDETLDCFASFIAGFSVPDVDEALRVEWRKVCRALGRRGETHKDQLLFSSPNVMAAFTQHATALLELTAQVPLVKGDRPVKNRNARLHPPASIVRPTGIRHVQQCVLWALKHRSSLTIVSGGHSGHCLWPNVVAVDMGALDQIHILIPGAGDSDSGSDSDSAPLVVAEAGCKTGDIISKTMAVGLTVPLGARPSVGAGLWLQGGMGHLSRVHGVASDAIVGAVVVGTDSGQVFYVGHVPIQHRPVGAVSPKNDAELLWAIKGAGTNFGIVVSVTFKAYAAPTYLTRNWIIPLSNDLEAQLRLNEFDNLIARKIPRNCSADAYLYWDAGQLHLGINTFESSTTGVTITGSKITPTITDVFGGTEDDVKVVDGVGVFETELYMSSMHGGHGGAKTSSFKRCLFLKDIGAANLAHILVAAVKTRPSPLSYLHLLQGGGAVGDVAAEATAFGSRDWHFACVVTGVWPRDDDGTELARSAVKWVYAVAADLLPFSTGAYSADLGPDPRDAELAASAFGPNRRRLARLKHKSDPHNILAYACPLPEPPMEPKLIILVTGEHGAGKDYCSDIWVSAFAPNVAARAISISDATKREYAASTNADANRLLQDRAYKEQHRSALTEFFEGQVLLRPQILQEHFLDVVYSAVEVDVLLITGMRDEAPVATLSHLVPGSRLLEVRVQSSEETRRIRRGFPSRDDGGDDNKDNNKDGRNKIPTLDVLDYRPCLIFNNNTTGSEAAKGFAENHLIPLLHEDLQRLANMVRPVPAFPRPDIEFRHVLNISQQPGGLALCTSLLEARFAHDWTKVGAIACCEAGGFVYASAISLRVDVPLVLIREAGKLPPPTVSVLKPLSHISSSTSNHPGGTRIEMERDIVPRGASVVVVDDVLATGETLCAVLQLLKEAGIGIEDVSVMVVAEFPVHGGRRLLHQRGFGRVNIQSLLVFGGA